MSKERHADIRGQKVGEPVTIGESIYQICEGLTVSREVIGYCIWLTRPQPHRGEYLGGRAVQSLEECKETMRLLMERSSSVIR